MHYNVEKNHMDFNKKIEDFNQVANKENWKFPQRFKALKEMGVDSYTVSLDKMTITYVGVGKEKYEKSLEGRIGSIKKEGSKPFDQKKVKEAVVRSQQGKTDYSQFIKEIMDAGVTYYVVDMKKNLVSYKDNAGNAYEEKVPGN